MSNFEAVIFLIFLGCGVLWAICTVFSWIWQAATAGQRQKENQQANQAVFDLSQYTIKNLRKQYDSFIKQAEYRKGTMRVVTTEPFSLYFGSMDTSYDYLQKFDLWKNDQFLCCISNIDYLIGKIYEYEDIITSGSKYDDDKKSLFNIFIDECDGKNIHAFCIPLDYIEYFSKGGEKYTTQEISGGGGTVGGFSLTGAVVGGAVAGDVGAIIGSRKKGKIDPITTTTTVHDETFCFIKYKNINGELCEVISNNSQIFYNALKQIIPEKEYSYVISRPQVQPQSKNDQKSLEDRLLSLKKLLDQGLITEEEYTQKRTTILNEI